jgi:hypothetical protein
VGHRLATSGIDRQALLRAVECLNLALLIDAEDQGVFRRVEVKTNDIDQLLRESRVVAHLEGPDQVRLQPIGAPDAADHRGIGPQHISERACAPMGGVGGLLLSGQLDDLPDKLVACLGRAPAPRRVFLDPRDPPFSVPIAPATDRGAGDTEFDRDILVLPASSGPQDDPGPLYQSGFGTTTAGPPLEGCLVFVAQREYTGASHGNILLPEENTHRGKISFMNSDTLH